MGLPYHPWNSLKPGSTNQQFYWIFTISSRTTTKRCLPSIDASSSLSTKLHTTHLPNKEDWHLNSARQSMRTHTEPPLPRPSACDVGCRRLRRCHHLQLMLVCHFLPLWRFSATYPSGAPRGALCILFIPVSAPSTDAH